ncbi:DUF2207 domain-containing protein [Candidatus Beckwithbacteria bacterium]|nr:DUF2207 domain-containing protein [Candidatus Beckwithbacteria bacterium]
MLLKKIFIGLFLLLCCAPSQVLASHADQISLFSSHISINQDTSISITETINYETTIEKHGIYRYVPQRYVVNGISYTAKVSNFTVTDGQLQSIPFTQSMENGNYTYKIGYADKTFTGPKTYIISYKVKDALRRFKDHDELYWDITGEGWQIPILKTEAVIDSPLVPITKVICYSGQFGQDNQLCQSNFSKNQAQFAYDQTINYGDNMTVAVALEPNNILAFPTAMQVFIKKLVDNLLILALLLPAIGAFLLWYYKGRDWMFISANIFDQDPDKPKKLTPLFYKHRIPLAYEPLKELTPGELGTMLDERVDNQDVVSEIIDLARKKYLKIEQTTKKGLLSSKEDFKFSKLKEADKDLPPQQKYLQEQLFKTGSEVMLSKLKGTFYQHMEKATSLIAKSVTDKKLFTSNPRTTKIMYFILAAFLAIGTFIASTVISGILYTGLPMLVAVVSFIFIIIFATNMVQKTAVGTNYMLQAKGLKETIKRGKWREEIKEKRLFIEEVLPFAIALGVVDKLAKDMDELNIKPPEYFQGDSTSFAKGYALGALTHSFTQQTSRSLSYNPSSRGWSGGSGFSSGGGFSGGGGGGGGGGSW